MKPHDPDKECIGDQARRKESCPASPDASTSRTKESNELQWARRHVPEDAPAFRPVQNVVRKTELLGTSPIKTPDEARKIRSRTMRNLKDPGSDISCHSLDASFRDFIGSLIERQDAIRDDLLFQITDLGQRIDEIEQRLERCPSSVRNKSPSELAGGVSQPDGVKSRELPR